MNESSQNALYKQRLNRVLRAVALEKPDRIPVVLQYAAFAAHVTKRPMAEFVRSPKNATETMIQAYRLIGGGDAMNYGSFYPYWLCYSFGAEVKIPGIDLPENEIWQVLETEVMSLEDYDRILDLGWQSYFQDFLEKRILKHVPLDRLPGNQKRVDIKEHWVDMGVPVLTEGTVTTPIELLSGSRSLPKFAIDLFKIPEKVEAVMDLIVPYLAAGPCRRAIRHGYEAVWIGGWRSAPSTLSPAMWNRFAWPYFRRLVNEVLDAGLIALLHLDSKWDRELARFRELPKGKCIMATDGETDLFKAKEVLGDHMCLMGDVPATMLCLGSPDEVYEYGTRLIRNLGPEGFILHSGCDIPANAKLENVQAMVAAATGK
jgi:uroporphyrinogen-III decarboxylase